MNGVAREYGVLAEPSIQFSLSEADEAVADLREGMGQLSSADLLTPDAEASYETFVAAVTETRRLIDERTPGDSQGTAGMPHAYDAITAELVQLRDELRGEVATSDQLLGRIGNLARFLVAFLVPAAVILIYRELVRRQQRQAELETRLEAERRINLAQEQFIANASHELRTPLTSIMGLSMTLAESDAVLSDAYAAELVGIIVGESEELARMVEDLLTVARLDAGALHYTFDDFEIHEELEDIRDGVVRAGMRVTADIEPCTVRADRLRFRQILRNLLSNARKYGGPNVRIEGHIDGLTYVCSVIDDGPGIPEELRPRLFKRFIHQGQHTTASQDSVGLGLSIVHSLALGMGGSVQYDNINGESHFSLRLPLTPAGSPAEEDLPAAQIVS